MQQNLERFHDDRFGSKITVAKDEMQQLRDCPGYKEYFNLKAA